MTTPAATTEPDLARRLWAQYEPVHAVVYFAPSVLDALKATGLRGFWMSYFAARFAPFGAATPDLAGALAFNFAPVVVERALPDAWTFTTPAAVLEARRDACAAALASLAGDAVDRATVTAAAEAGESIVVGLDVGGRALAAANRSVAPGDDPWGRLWQACTTLREHRGDGHVAALVAEGLDGLEAHVLQVARGTVPRDVLQGFRGWTDDEWRAAEDRLQARGWVDDTGRLTEQGREVRDRIEDRTDDLAARPWAGREAERAAFGAGVAPVVRAIAEVGLMPYPNPIGLPPADEGAADPVAAN